MSHPWLWRIARAVLVLFCVAALVVQLTTLLPGDPALVILGQESTEAQREALREELGLNAGYFTRLFEWLGGVFTGDWGTSFVSGRPVLGELLQRVPVTFEIVVLAQIVALGLAVPIGLWTAYHFRGAGDKIASGISFVLLATPPFVIGLVLIYVFAVSAGALPASGWVPMGEDFAGHLRSLVLPVLTIALADAAVYLRTFRGAVLETLTEPYIYAATTRGASPRWLQWHRVLRPASSPLVTLVGLQLGISLGGTLVVETLFAIPGMGRLAISALGSRDIPLMQGTVLFAAVAVVVASMAVDVVVNRIDPRSSRDQD